jgi:hypothetical protein
MKQEVEGTRTTSSSISYGSAGTENIMLRKLAQYESEFCGRERRGWPIGLLVRERRDGAHLREEARDGDVDEVPRLLKSIASGGAGKLRERRPSTRKDRHQVRRRRAPS